MALFKIFEGLSKSETNRVFNLGIIRPVEEGELLFHKGDPGHEMYIILTGRISVIDDCDIGISDEKADIVVLGPGEILGEMAIFEKSHERSAHAIAAEPSQILVLSEDILENFFEKKAPRKFLANIIRVLCGRLRITTRAYVDSKYAHKTSGIALSLSENLPPNAIGALSSTFVASP